jgi:hypothetical protein
MKLTLKELERVMIFARLVKDQESAKKRGGVVDMVVWINEDRDIISFTAYGSAVWFVRAEQFKRGRSPEDIFVEERDRRERLGEG